MRQTLVQCKKELTQFWRYQATVMLAIMLPFVTLLIFGSAIRLETKNVPLVVQDMDKSPLSREYIDRFIASNQYSLVHPVYNDRAGLESNASIRHAMDSSKAKIAMIIPPNFSRLVKDKRPSEVQFIIDGSDVVNSNVLKNGVLAITDFFQRENGLSFTKSKINPHARIWFNPGRREELFILPGVFTLILALYPGILSSIAMVREKEDGNISQVYASGVPASKFILGKLLAYIIVGIGQAAMTVGLGCLIFKLWLVGDVLVFIISSLIFLAVSVMFGIMGGTFSDNQASAIQIVGTTNALSIISLSGFIYPVTNIPFPAQLVSYIVPAQYFIQIMRDCFVRGTGWTGTWHFIIILALFGLAEYFITLNRIKRMQLQK